MTQKRFRYANSISLISTIGTVALGACLIVVFAGGAKVYSAPSPILLSPPENLKYFTFGYNESIADGLWLRTIQDLDVCEKAGVSARKTVSSFAGSTAGSSAGPGASAQVTKCNKGWPFRMLLAITEIAPRFRSPYMVGAITLSVLGEDRDGATILFERGLKQIKDDWNLPYRAAYHFMIEVGDSKRASELLIQAGNQGAPMWVYSLAARLLTREGQIGLAEGVLTEQIEKASDEQIKAFLTRRLDEVRANAANR